MDKGVSFVCAVIMTNELPSTNPSAWPNGAVISGKWAPLGERDVPLDFFEKGGKSNIVATSTEFAYWVIY